MIQRKRLSRKNVRRNEKVITYVKDKVSKHYELYEVYDTSILPGLMSSPVNAQ